MEKANHRHTIQPMDIKKALEDLRQRIIKGDVPTETEIKVEKRETLAPYDNPVKVIGKGYDDTTKKNDAKLKRKLKREMNKKDTPACNNLISTLEESDSFFK